VNDYNLKLFFIILFFIFISSCKENPSLTPPIEDELFPNKDFVIDNMTGNIIYTEIDTSDFHSSDNCYQCHPIHVKEWKRSMHAYSMRDPVFFSGWYEERLKNHNTGERFCIQCHSPVAYVTGEKLDEYTTAQDLQNDTELSKSIKEGVTCTVCHSFTGITGTTVIEDNVAATAEYYMNPGEGIMYGPLDIEKIECSDDMYCHDVKYNGLFKFSESCLPCHNMTVRGKELETTYSEWQSIQHLGMGGQVPCQECHMPFNQETGHHSHEFIGVDIDLTMAVPDDSLQYKSVEKLLQNSLEIKFEDIIIEPSKLKILISIQSLTAHSLPSGTSFSREAWLETVVKDVDKDSILFSSGTLQDPTSNLDLSDSDLLLYSSNLLDAGGNIIHSVTDAYDIDRKMLPGLKSDEHLYKVDGSFISGTQVNVSSMMHFRAFKPDLLIEELLVRQPVFIMEKIDTTFIIP